MAQKRASLEEYDSIERQIWSLAAVAAITFTMRIWCRCRGTRKLWWDDYLLVLASIFLIANAGMMSMIIRELAIQNQPLLYLYGNLANTFNPLSQIFSKCSVATTLLKVTSGWWKTSLWVGMFIISSFLFAQLWVTWVHDCSDLFGGYYELPGVCFQDPYAVWAFRVAITVISIAFDVYLTLLPWKIVHELRLNAYEKVGLALSMGLGAFAGATGVVRLVNWFRIFTISQEEAWDLVMSMFLWNFIEPAATIIAASLAMFRVLGRDLVRWGTRTYLFSRYYGQNLHSGSAEMINIPGQGPTYNGSPPCAPRGPNIGAQRSDKRPEAR
ncbi:hypothetical protein F5B20DRAFT_375598 [Whalleya microplaca]|nr:hypothetical protein F5B20DRAFT_375598 [Whalleya microplaca]